MNILSYVQYMSTPFFEWHTAFSNDVWLSLFFLVLYTCPYIFIYESSRYFVNSALGLRKTSLHFPDSTTSPFCMTMTVSQKALITSRSWDMKRTASERFSRSLIRSWIICACTETSSMDVISSASRSADHAFACHSFLPHSGWLCWRRHFLVFQIFAGNVFTTSFAWRSISSIPFIFRTFLLRIRASFIKLAALGKICQGRCEALHCVHSVGRGVFFREISLQHAGTAVVKEGSLRKAKMTTTQNMQESSVERSESTSAAG